MEINKVGIIILFVVMVAAVIVNSIATIVNARAFVKVVDHLTADETNKLNFKKPRQARKFFKLINKGS